jgi:Ran GTPase-activating protein (RanGAP) involved in mRNA processing and transport
LNLSKCKIEKQGMTALFKSMQKNSDLCSCLEVLIISHNSLATEGSNELGAFLDISKLKRLDMSNTSPFLFALGGKVLFPENFSENSQDKTLTTLDISHNKLTRKESPMELAKFISTLKHLTDLNVSGTKVAADTIKSILVSCSKLAVLDISDNEFGDDGTWKICDLLTQKSPMLGLKKLNLSKNLTGRSKSRQKLTDGIIGLLSSTETKLDTLILTGELK